MINSRLCNSRYTNSLKTDTLMLAISAFTGQMGQTRHVIA